MQTITASAISTKPYLLPSRLQLIGDKSDDFAITMKEHYII